jgi:hypothetical protein
VRPVAPFLPEQYIILALIFVLGLVLGMFLFSGGKWKRRYKEEARLRADLEAENARLRKDHAEADSLHRAAIRNPVRDPAHRNPL